MKKKVIVNYKDGGKLIYRGYKNRDDNYFIALHKYSLEVVNITRQYYPLKDNEVEVIFDKEKNGYKYKRNKKSNGRYSKRD